VHGPESPSEASLRVVHPVIPLETLGETLVDGPVGGEKAVHLETLGETLVDGPVGGEKAVHWPISARVRRMRSRPSVRGRY